MFLVDFVKKLKIRKSMEKHELMITAKSDV